MTRPVDALFAPFRIGSLSLPNRLVMAPMGRLQTDNNLPRPTYPEYFRKRAAGGVGLLIGEAVAVDHAVACSSDKHAFFHGDPALQAWKDVVDAVHGAGGAFMPQLWHGGLLRGPNRPGAFPNEHLESMGPSGWAVPLVHPQPIGSPIEAEGPLGIAMTERDIADVVASFARAAADAVAIGADGIEIHAAHGYLIDQFLWPRMNRRTDGYGGSIANRVRFAAEIVSACRAAVPSNFPIFFRYSQWKQQDYGARPAATPAELEQFLAPLVDAGVDLFDCSTRRFWEPAFAGSDLSVAGWTRKLSGRPTMAVGSVGLDKASWDTANAHSVSSADAASLDPVIERLERGEYDLVGLGRMLIPNPDWPQLIRSGATDRIRPYSNANLAEFP
ncbi:MULTISPECIES: 12-oxophytodienoate reductase [unclassified Sphingobium]|uniref:oxidoreductase n=1 Tax=unclassified Sphingobium TaxID=2611147 RepID=UPI000D17CDB5|nr:MULTISPECIES: 12-oxophytodienoate reductase [unclassified Sphingobium]MBG6120043.1 2,4-dienoyl-CoA reductase-like NADH-dependent reductase (Old Yellow Enzyme family) [Sphingobium sp. JAI105]PSO13105.1 12-oxophytodienoate reductase [Sphingobium sp. AEW4]TWD05756.1 2,4-dienoyl-CoA reductase-like NADH-dependent reductase (Old Yellow Enzyme family) [Sphingobium sp. AEW010]TWD23309.1 2,4-dienoyl-CoA reductase-like NADH-dependent reductase (Old Yellow Enzyme family) [Sphingobium sp. AEW013]TWD251